ncbi:MAG TPA: MAPEG family protein [Polyangiaceae bacterium]|nr:MAPEG family protein [Polyangiaceae bacterium]
MTIPLICVFIAFSLIYLPKLPLSVAMAKSPGGYNNRQPRDQQAALEGWGKRAGAAHANGFEAFAPFAAAVFTAHLVKADPQTSAILAIVHVTARTIYPVAYIAGVHLLRSTVWCIGFGATVGLFIAAFWA